jgi:hypothetical protein
VKHRVAIVWLVLTCAACVTPGAPPAGSPPPPKPAAPVPTPAPAPPPATPLPTPAPPPKPRPPGPSKASAAATLALAKLWDAEHVSPPISPLVDHADVERRITALAAAKNSVVSVRQIGASVEKREIWDVSFGTGPFVVLMWSQMHGDEPTATSALFDLYEYLRRHRDEPAVRQILGALTVHTIPMLNPDGAERLQRRNAQGLDLNRDALLLQSPEGQLLKKIRDELKPRVGFNLHNQSWATSAGRPPRPASMSLLSVAYDEAGSMNDGRRLTKRLAAVVRDAVEPLAGNRIGRYDDAFEPRAFGDNLTRLGTPVLLIETGAWPEPNPDPPLVRLNFVALVRALQALADGSVNRANPDRYDSLPRNEPLAFQYLIRNVSIRSGGQTLTGDVGLSATRRIRVLDARRRLVQMSSVADLGDLRTYCGVFEIDGTGKVIAPLAPGAPVPAVGATVKVGNTAPIQIGGLVNLMLLAPAAGGSFKVERVFPAETIVQ